MMSKIGQMNQPPALPGPDASPTALPPPFPSLPPLPQALPVWPKVCGITAIAIAGYSLVTQLMGLAMAAPMSAVFQHIGGTSPFDAAALRFLYVNAAGLLALTILLLAGGIALLRRRPSSRKLLYTWAVARIVFAALLAPAQYDYTMSMFTKIATMPMPTRSTSPVTTAPVAGGSTAPTGTVASPTAPAPPAARTPSSPLPGTSTAAIPGFPIKEMAVMGMIFGLLMGCVLPVITLIGLSLPKVIHQMRCWSSPDPLPPPMPNLY